MNWDFDDSLITADRHSFFKFMTQSVAERHVFRPTFMPKPIAGLTGNDYKRINAPQTVSGATWAPNTLSGTGNNGTHMARVQRPGRFEPRLPLNLLDALRL